MSTFSGYHIQQFNQRCKGLVGEGKVVLTHKELRDLQAEILDLLNALRAAESTIAELKTQAAGDISVELQGGNF
jgi:predicted  nucleic acid-binding Zn-ribbon protein